MVRMDETVKTVETGKTVRLESFAKLIYRLYETSKRSSDPKWIEYQRLLINLPSDAQKAVVAVEVVR
jgi:hypothetical protein